MAFNPQAEVIITTNPAEMGQRSTWSSAIVGQYVADPRLVRDTQKAVTLKFHDARRIQRNILISDDFAAKHSELMAVVSKAARGSLWTLFRDVARFKEMFAAALKTHRDTYFVALVTKSQIKEDCGHHPNV